MIQQHSALSDEDSGQRAELEPLQEKLETDQMPFDPKVALVEHAPLQLAYLDRHLRFVYANDAYCKGCGYSKEELIGRGHFELFPHPENETIFRHVIEHGEPAFFQAKPFVHPMRPQDPITFWDWTLVPVKDEKGQVQGLVFSLEEVSDRVAIAEALHRSDVGTQALHEMDQTILRAGSVTEIAQIGLHWLERLLPLTHASVTTFHQEEEQLLVLAVGNEESADFRAGARFSVPVESWPENLPHRLVPVNKVMPSAIQALYTQDSVYALQFPIHENGRLVGSLNLGLMSKDDLTSSQRLFADQVSHQIAIGIQQVRNNERLGYHAQELERLIALRSAELQASEARFRTIFEQAPLGIGLMDRNCRVYNLNPQGQRILGCEGDEIPGQALADRIDISLVDLMAGFETLWNGERDTLRVEVHYAVSDNDERWIEAIFSYLEKDLDSAQVLVILTDVTERREAHQNLLQAEQLAVMGKLAATFAHEINNPLQSVVGCLGLAHDVLSNESQAMPYIELARSELLRVTRLVQRLRDLGRPIKGGTREPVDLKRMLSEIANLNQPRAEEAGISVITRLDELPLVQGVNDRLRQVFLNLITNAIEAMPQGGCLTIGTHADSDSPGVIVTVADTGVGMSEEMQARLFEPFNTTKKNGLGLGLHITREIVREHGGEIDVTSQEGKGSTFRVWLPAELLGTD